MTKDLSFRRLMLVTFAGTATMALAACGEENTAESPPAQTPPATATAPAPGGTTGGVAGTAGGSTVTPPAETQAEAPARPGAPTAQQ